MQPPARASHTRALFRSLLGALLCTGAAIRPLGAQSAAAIAADSTTEDLINADRPGIADGSRVVNAGQLQLELGFQRERHTDADARSTLTFAPTLLRLGLTDRLEARVESNTLTHERAVASDGTVDRSTGLSPVLLGLKLTLYDSRGDDRRSLGAIVRVAPPSGSNGFGTSHATGDVRLAADWDFAPALSLNPNVGAARLEGADGSPYSAALGALTLTWLPSPRITPFIDAGYQSREDAGGTWSLVLDAGLGYIVGRDVQVDVSAGTGAHGDAPPRPFVAVGVSVRATAFHGYAHSLDRAHGNRPVRPAR